MGGADAFGNLQWGAQPAYAYGWLPPAQLFTGTMVARRREKSQDTQRRLKKSVVTQLDRKVPSLQRTQDGEAARF